MSEAGKADVDRPGLYRFTSIARPIDPTYPTNRALLYILPVVGLLSAALSFLLDLGQGPLPSALSGVLTALAAWALTRELAPDFVEAAFVALAIAWLIYLVTGSGQVLTVFAAILLLRCVNRTTGLPLTLFDTVSVLGFCTFAAIQAGQPILILVMSLAFVLDASLAQPRRLHFLAAIACLPLFAWAVDGSFGLAAGVLNTLDWVLLGVSFLALAAMLIASSSPISYNDVSHTRLLLTRVNAGLGVGWLVAVQAILTQGTGAWLDTALWCCLLASFLSFCARQLLLLKNRLATAD